MIKRFEGNHPKDCEYGRKSRIQFESDVVGDYFDRNKNSGDLTIYLDGQPYSNWGSINGYQGIWTLNLNLPSSSSISTEYEVKVVVSDPSSNNPLEEIFFVKVVPNIKTKGNPVKGNRNGPRGRKNKGASKKTPNLQLPRIVEVAEEEWADHNFDKESGFLVKEAGNGSHVYFVNVDNIYLKQEQKIAINVDPSLLKYQFMLGLSLLGMGLVLDYEAKRDTYEEDIEQLSRKASNWFSPVALATIRGLGSLDTA